MNENRPILIVDDNLMDVDLARRAMARCMPAIPVEVAMDGDEALACLPRWEAGEPPPQVILLDINMPRVTGLEVLERLKAHPLFRRIPVVMLTTSGEMRDVEEAYRLGCNSYIVKPVDFSEFASAIETVCNYWCRLNRQP